MSPVGLQASVRHAAHLMARCDFPASSGRPSLGSMAALRGRLLSVVQTGILLFGQMDGAGSRLKSGVRVGVRVGDREGSHVSAEGHLTPLIIFINIIFY